jgi:predicted O-methyltransferase YrrM
VAAKKLLDKIEGESNRQLFPIIGPVKGEILAEEIKKKKPKNILEVGTFIGYSSILMAHAWKKASITTLEINPRSAKKALENFKLADVSNRVDLIIGNALDTIPKLNKKFDFLFLDARKKEYIDYLRLVESKLKKGAVVFADNVGVFENELRDYLLYVRDSGNYTSRTVNVGEDAVEISVKLE